MRAVNLIPSESRAGSTSGSGRSGGSAYAVLAAVGGLAILALLYGMANHHISSRRSQLAALSVRTELAQGEAAQLTPYTSFLALREERTKDVAQLVESRFDWAHAFSELGRVLPKDASISSLDGTITSGNSEAAALAAAAAATASTKAASAVASATPPGAVPSFSLSGCATSQAEVARTLARLRLIDGVSEVTLEGSSQSSTNSAAAAAHGEGCGPSQPAFSVNVSFEPLPEASATAATATTATTATAATTATGARG